MLWTQIAAYGYRPLQSESFMQPTAIGGARVVKTEEDGAGGGTTQMLWLQIWPAGQSALWLQPTLMGAAEELGAGAGGAATQMLC